MELFTFIVGVDASDVSFEVFSPAEQLVATLDTTPEHPGTEDNFRFFGDAPPTTVLG